MKVAWAWSKHENGWPYNESAMCGSSSRCVAYIMRCVAPVIHRGLIKRLDMFRSCYMLVKQSEAMKAKQCKKGQCLVKQSIIA